MAGFPTDHLEGINDDRKEFRVVGKPHLPGRLSWAMATGVAKYGGDYAVDDMLHAKFLRSPYANARIKSIDTAKAMKIPGVVEIITWEDEEVRSFITNSADQEGMEIGAVVVAENEDICEEALKQLNVEWEVLPHVVDLREGRKPDAPVIRAIPPPAKAGGGMGMGGGANPPKQGNVSFSNVSEGDVEAGFKEADHIIEIDVNTSSFAGHIPDPLGSVAWWFDSPYHGEGKNLRIEGVPWGHGQVPRTARIPQEKVFQECMLMGGRYCDWGTRGSQLITPMLSRRTGKPVRCVINRSQMYDFNLNERYVRLKVGYKSNGLITAIDDFTIADGGVQGSSNFGNTMDQTFGPYFTTRCLNVRQRMEVVDSNRGKMWVSGQHNPMNWDSLTVALYTIAEKLGKDIIDIATLNLHGPTSQTDPDPVPSYEMCVKAAKKMINWQWHQPGTKKLPDGRMHGFSFRYQQSPRHAFSGYNPKLELRNGRIHLAASTTTIGCYIIEANLMTVAEELGLEYGDIILKLDHNEIFRSYGGGSDGTTASSWALKECAHILKTKILERAVEEANNPPAAGGFGGFGKKPTPSPFIGLKPEDLDLRGGQVVLKADPGVGVPLAQAVRANLFATYSGRPPAAAWNQRGKVLDVMNVAMSEVAVDTETGDVEVLRHVIAADPGKVLRRTSFEGQLHQVMFFSEGCQLSEEFIFDKATGVRLNTNMIEYKKPTMADIAPVDMELLESRLSNAAYGGSGISHSLANTHLIICAIHNAIGKWVDPPATPDKVLKALGKA